MNINSRLGYPCINVSLQREKGVTTNRHIIKKTFEAQRGTLQKVSEIGLQNTRDLIEIIKWNERNGIKFFRMSSNMFPWMSEYELTDLPDWEKIKNLLSAAGKLANQYGQRIEFHPGPFNVLGSHNKSVVEKTIKDINQHAEIFDAMGFKPSHWNQINIHVNTTQGGKEIATERFCENFHRLSPSAKARLVVENDDKPSQYSVKDLFELVYSRIQTPITFDVHHHKFCSGNMSHSEAAKLAASTWPVWVPAGFHFASTINHESPTQMARAHADWIYDEITDYGTGAWIMCECKAKEEAVLSYIKEGPKKSDYKETFQLILS